MDFLKKITWAAKSKAKNIPAVNKNQSWNVNLWDTLIQDFINPYEVIFNPSYVEVNGTKLIDFFALNDMSGTKRANYMLPILRYKKNTTVSLFFSPLDSKNFVENYEKKLRQLRWRLRDVPPETYTEAEKQMEKIIISYQEMLDDFRQGRDNYLNYSILFSQKLDYLTQEYDDQVSIRERFIEQRKETITLFQTQVQSPSKFYIPVGQQEEAFITQQPLCEFRMKDWSNITAVNSMMLYPFFSQSKEPSYQDGVPYGINRTTQELFFFNHSGLYNRKEITNRNMNIFWGTWSWKTSFLRSQIPLRIAAYNDHFIIMDPKNDYSAFTMDLGGQVISFTIDKPMWYNIFSRSTEMYTRTIISDKGPIDEYVEVQSVENKKQNLAKIFSVMCPFLADRTDDAEFGKMILDSAVSKVYQDDPTGESVSLQKFYDIYLTRTIDYYIQRESEKINSYTRVGELLRATLSQFVIKEDWSAWKYYKMFQPVPPNQQLKLQRWPLISFNLSWVFNDDSLFSIACLIGFEFVWSQIATEKWDENKTIYVVIDENWKLLKFKQAAEYEEGFSRLIRWLWGGIYTMSQNLTEYVKSDEWRNILDQAQVSVVLKLEENQLEHLKVQFPKWFTEDVNKEFSVINKGTHSFGKWFMYLKSKIIPLNYLYLPSTSNTDSWQEKKAWQANLQSDLAVTDK